ncbi:uncharacterized protein FIESC28_07036 [Fusarium coffeatum]|uniref:Uncharacterized protein n=1 Tax=Fusarium coffeatum TaxID=231269 RepID=A0A366RGD7_9HYPO|nr:uncharacterized protein FIESC28_07036 [Fusarium coffeatum]RBR16204.1 hypothetical protein FIESC28_07036 [Fusarium coffeatum]
MGKFGIDLSLTGLATEASKLNLNNPEAEKKPSSTDRYQKYPFSRFNMDETQPDVLDKNSPQYRERVIKLLDALDETYQKKYTEYLTQRARYIAMVEADEERIWNRYILNPFDKTLMVSDLKLHDFKAIDFEDRFIKINNREFFYLRDLQLELFYIGRLVRTGRLERARLEESDTFIQLRNEWADMLGDYIDDDSVCSDEEGPSICWSSDGSVIED